MNARAASREIPAAPPIAVGLAVLAALVSLTGVVEPGRWLVLAGVAVAVVLATAHRRRTRAGTLATSLTAGLTGLLVAAATALRPVLGAEGSLGTRLAGLGRDAVSAIADGAAPLPASTGLEVGLVLGAALLTVLVDLIVLGLRRPGIGAAALAGVWSVTLVFERPPVTVVALGGATTLVLLLWAARPTGRAAPPAGQAPAAVAIALVVAVLALLIAPLASSLPGWASATLGARWGTVATSGLLSLSTNLDLRADLGNRPDRTVLTYRTEAVELGPLRTSTLVDFDGRRWAPSPAGDLLPTGAVLWPEPTTAVPTEQVDVQVTDLDQRSLPIPLDPRTVDAGPAWRYDPANDAVVSTGTGSAGLSYTLDVARRDLSPQALRADRPHAAEPDAVETQVVSSHADQIAELARSVVGDATNIYDDAVALQSWFRDTSRFTYSVDVPPARSDDAVWDFLEDRRGYCVQFATAMTLMARSLGIPARVGVGFLPGERGLDGVWQVSARRAHAWPELWFADSGWVRFEPTPAVQTGAVPVYADPNAGAAATQELEVPTATATAVPSVSPSPQAPVPSATASPSASGSTAPIVVVGLALAAIGVVAVASRRRWQPVTPDRAWSRVRAAASKHLAWTGSTTPRQAAELLREHLLRTGHGSAEADAACVALERLVAVVEAERYAPSPREWTGAELGEWVEQILAELTRADRAASPSAPRSG